MEMDAVLHRAIDVRASDIFIIAGLPLTYKVNGRQLREGEMLTPADTAHLVEGIYALCGRNMDRCAAEDADDDFSFAIPHLGRLGQRTAPARQSCGGASGDPVRPA